MNCQHVVQGESMTGWQEKYEAYISKWPTLFAQYRALPQWHKRDCAYAMKWWVELGLVKEKA